MMKGSAMIFFCSLMLCTTCSTMDTLTPGQFLRDGETILSTSETFELGFFSPGSSRHRYLGIWYKKVSPDMIVWVANRDNPLNDASGVLDFTSQGNLVLVNGNETIVWSSNVSRPVQNPVAWLLESGNFVIREGNDTSPASYLWQSFDFPCDTLLAGMKVGKNLITGFEWIPSSWKSTEDPAQGDFKLRIDLRGIPQLLVSKGSNVVFRSGSWNGLRLTGVPSMVHTPPGWNHFVSDQNEVYYMFDILNSSLLFALVLKPTGILQRFTWMDPTHGNWMDYFYALQVDECDKYAYCGAYACCSMNRSPVCSCLKGFVPQFPEQYLNFSDWSGGCVRRAALNCSGKDHFMKYAGIKLPDTSKAWVNESIGLKECEQLCTKNCSCMAYANWDIRGEGSGCVLWFGELLDMREFNEGGQDIYVRLAASEQAGIEKRGNSNMEKIKISGIIAAGLLLIILGLLFYVQKKKHQKKAMNTDDVKEGGDDGESKEDIELKIFDLSIITNATDNFSWSKKLGQGGFGPVYKGTLVDGQEIAVKRLSSNSGQGVKEFKNEVTLISKLQHRNLVKLLGCCIQGDERMLIYEYLPNKSLDFFIFDQTRSRLLDWHKRFQVISGIARGLLYLHQDSRLRIIHRDLKASNVLLDNDLNPKIADFGLARAFGIDQSVANTNRVVGTYGYMSPEYAVDGLFSVKSDVFSFGVLALEIISGKRNRGFCHPDHGHNLLGHAWRLWIEERGQELTDEILLESCDLSQVLRCIHIGLLCVQQLPESRPNMSTVVLMLGTESLMLPEPKQPGFYTERNPVAADSSSSKEGICSINEMSTVMLEPR